MLTAMHMGFIQNSLGGIHCVLSTLLFKVFHVFFAQPSAGPAKKGKPSSAVGGKSKKTSDSKEATETELSVSLSAYIYISVKAFV